jgi:hypothetical protein
VRHFPYGPIFGVFEEAEDQGCELNLGLDSTDDPSARSGSLAEWHHTMAPCDSFLDWACLIKLDSDTNACLMKLDSDTNAYTT